MDEGASGVCRVLRVVSTYVGFTEPTYGMLGFRVLGREVQEADQAPACGFRV